MKILITTDTYVPVVNGVVTSVVNLKAGLEARGHDVRILALSHTKRSHIDGDIYFIGSYDMSMFYPSARIKGRRTTKETADIIRWKPDIIHTQSEFSTFYVARKIAKRLNVPMVHTYHTMYEDYTHYFAPSKRVGKKAVTTGTNYVAKRVDAIIAPTEKICNMIEKYGVCCNVCIVPSGIKLDKFQKEVDEQKICEIKEKLGVPSDHFVLVSVSRIGKEKNIDEIIRKMDYFRDKKISLLIVGDGPYRHELEKLTHELDLCKSVKFTGMVDPLDVPTYYKVGDIFVSASTSETQGLTYIEALAAGNPILCRQDDCLDGVLEEGKNGFSFTNDEEFLQKLEFFMTKADRKQMVECARATSEKYSIKVFAKKIEEIYIRYAR